MQTISEYPAQPGDLVGFKTKGAFAALIRLGQRLARCTNWHVTHIGVIVDCAGGDPQIVQSVRRVNKVPLSSYVDTPHVILPFPSRGWGRAEVCLFAESCIGRKYGVLSVLSRAWNTVTPKWVQFGISRAGDMDCSGLGARAWEHGGVCIPWPDPLQVMPAQLADFALKETS